MSESRLQFVRREVYPTHIARRFPDGDQVGFRLVPKGRSGGPDDFYMMQDKVSIRFYRKYAAERPDQTGADLGAGADDRLPMMGVTVQEAYDFAQWLGGTGSRDKPQDQWFRANLPTT